MQRNGSHSDQISKFVFNKTRVNVRLINDNADTTIPLVFNVLEEITHV